MFWFVQGCNLKYVKPLSQLRRKELTTSLIAKPSSILDSKDCRKRFLHGNKYGETTFSDLYWVQSFFEQKTVASTPLWEPLSWQPLRDLFQKKNYLSVLLDTFSHIKSFLLLLPKSWLFFRSKIKFSKEV